MQAQFMPQLNSRVALHLNLFENQLLNTQTLSETNGEIERDRESERGGERAQQTVQRWEVWVLSKNYGFAASASVAVAVAFEFEIRILTHAKR